MGSNLILTTWLLVAGAGAVACRQPSVPLSNDERVIQAWLKCEECSDGELAAVVKLGTQVVPRFGEALRSGPSQEALDEVRKQSAASHQRMVEYAKTHPNAPVPMSERDYVNRQEENFIVLYQSRSATALRAIGGPDARKELTQAASLPLRPAVLAVVQEALANMP